MCTCELALTSRDLRKFLEFLFEKNVLVGSIVTEEVQVPDRVSFQYRLEIKKKKNVNYIDLFVCFSSYLLYQW